MAPILLVRIDRDQSVMCSASTKSSCSWVPDALEDRSIRRTCPDVRLARGSFVSRLAVQLFSGVIGVMADEEIPRHGLVFARGCEESWYRFLDAFALVVTCLKEEDLGAIDSKPRGKRSTSGTRSYNDVFIAV